MGEAAAGPLAPRVITRPNLVTRRLVSNRPQDHRALAITLLVGLPVVKSPIRERSINTRPAAANCAGGPAADEFLSPSVIADLEVTYRFTDRAGLTVGANNLFNKYPDKLKPVNQGATGFALYNTASPYGTNGGFYYTRLFYEF